MYKQTLKNIAFNLILCFFFKEKLLDLNYISIEFKHLFENTHNIQNAKSDWSRYVIHRAITGHFTMLCSTYHCENYTVCSTTPFKLLLVLSRKDFDVWKLLSVDFISSWSCTCCSASLVRLEIITITWSCSPDDNWDRDNLINRWS